MHGVSLRKHGIVYGLAALVSLLLSYWASIRGAVINPDAICYLQSAQTLKDGLQAATQLCGQAKWPFYSALIYSVTYVTHLSYLHSAYILDAIFSCVSVLTFVAIVETLFSTPTKRILWLAAIVVLLGHEFNAVREYIIRDHGFWCFYLLSILFLLNYFRTKQWCYALAWNMSVILATLFRIEGIIFLALLPLASFIGHRSNGWRSFFKLNALTSLILIFGIFIVVLYPQHFSHYLTRINEVQFQLLHGVSEIAHRFQESAKILSQQVLSQYSAHESMLILSLVLLAWYMISVIVNLSVIYAVLVVYAWSKKLMNVERSQRIVLWSYVVINVLITAAFLFENMFLSKRYLLALSLTLMLWVPFALYDLLGQWKNRKWPLCVASFFILVSAIGGIFDFGYSKSYIRDAGMWLESNVPINAKLYANDYQLMYYSQHFGNAIFAKGLEYADLHSLSSGHWKQFDYIAIRANRHDAEKSIDVVKELGKPEQVFVNKRGDAVSIYRVRGNTL